MKLEQSFEVAAPIERVWEALIDVEHVAPCLPGAAVTGRNDDGSYNGTFTIKIGPTTAAYAGKLEMEQVDESVRTTRRCTRRAPTSAARAAPRPRSSRRSWRTSRRRDARRRRHRLPHHRPAGPIRPRRDDRGHLRAAAARVREAAAGVAGRGPRGRRRCHGRRGDRGGAREGGSANHGLHAGGARPRPTRAKADEPIEPEPDPEAKADGPIEPEPEPLAPDTPSEAPAVTPPPPPAAATPPPPPAAAALRHRRPRCRLRPTATTGERAARRRFAGRLGDGRAGQAQPGTAGAAARRARGADRTAPQAGLDLGHRRSRTPLRNRPRDPRQRSGGGPDAKRAAARHDRVSAGCSNHRSHDATRGAGAERLRAAGGQSSRRHSVGGNMRCRAGGRSASR